MDTLQLSLLAVGVVLLLLVLLFNQWQSRRNVPRQAQPLPEEPGTPGQEPALDPVVRLEPDFVDLPQPDRRPVLDALIDALATIEVDHPVSGDAALAALPSTRRVGTKALHIEGCGEQSGEWEPVLAGRRYTAFQAGVQLANRIGAISEIEYSEFVIKAQAFADAVGGTAVLSEMSDEVARGRELDQFASAHDAQLTLTLVARDAAWSPGYIQQHAARLGFVPGVMPGRMVLAAEVPGLPPVLSLTFDTQAALAEDPGAAAVRECVLSLDVPQVARDAQPFARLRQSAQWLAQEMDGLLTDGSGQQLSEQAMNLIAHDLEGLYDALDQRGLSAGSPQARRLFS